MNEKELVRKIYKLAGKIGKDVALMEVCGTHTQAISRFGIRELLPKNLKLISGPGCPVCVTDQFDIDAVIEIAKSGVSVATYGDAIRVPGNNSSLEEIKTFGGKVYSVYCVSEVFDLMKKDPEVVFFGLGFDTTTPMSAYAMKKGMNIYSTHKLFFPAMMALSEMGKLKIDGFINPGHVSSIIGLTDYEKLPLPQVVTGFTQKDVLEGIYMLLAQIAEDRSDVENQYKRLVKKEGNKKARDIIFDVFEVANGIWRGFGVISGSGLEPKKAFEKQDAKKKYAGIIKKVKKFNNKKSPCICGEIIRGLKQPNECPMFGKACVPEKPFGPCMVSVEGVCNVDYRYKK